MNATYLLQVILISFSLLIFNGCSDSSPEVQSLAGKWRMTFNQDVNCTDSMDNYLLEEFSSTPCLGGEEICVYLEYDFGADNKMLELFSNYTESGEDLESISESATYSIEGDSVTICTSTKSDIIGLLENDCFTTAYTISFDETRLTMNYANPILDGCEKTLSFERL